MGTQKSPRVRRHSRAPQSTFGLDDLVAPIKGDLPELMKAASRLAKEGNATVLAALINLFSKYAEAQVGEKAAEIFKYVQDLRQSNLDQIANEDHAQGT